MANCSETSVWQNVSIEIFKSVTEILGAPWLNTYRFFHQWTHKKWNIRAGYFSKVLLLFNKTAFWAIFNLAETFI